jgi:hypothetical protein
VPQDGSDFIVDVAADSLHAASPRQTADGRLCDALDVLAHHFSMALCTTFT